MTLGWRAYVAADWAANEGNPKGRLVTLLFRTAQQAHQRRPWWRLPYIVFYQLTGWVLGLELPASVTAGPGLRIEHGQGLVVHRDVSMGARCTLRHTTTLGERPGRGRVGAPRLGSDVDVGAHAMILGPISIGDAAVVGGGAVVTKDVDGGAIVVGVPSRVLGRHSSDPEAETPGE